MKIKKILSQINYLNFSKKFKSKNLEEDFFIYFPYEGNIESIHMKTL
ncbi:hypothetical protein [Fusobacterium ulcerans]|nr:hypothetical protein [Fusobacterium ulcerans]